MQALRAGGGTASTLSLNLDHTCNAGFDPYQSTGDWMQESGDSQPTAIAPPSAVKSA